MNCQEKRHQKLVQSGRQTVQTAATGEVPLQTEPVSHSDRGDRFLKGGQRRNKKEP